MNNLPVAGRRVPPLPSYSRKRAIPPIGTEFGCWVVIENGLLKNDGERTRPACRVRCGCGREAICSTTLLQHRRSTRCKRCAWAETFNKKRAYCAVAHPMIPVGTKFGRWNVIENGLRVGKIRAVRVRCSCDDRTERIHAYFPLRNGQSTSCGCRGKERSIEPGWVAVYGNLRNSARLRGLDCHLTLPQIKELSKLPCAYCGREPSNVCRQSFAVPGTSKRAYDPSVEFRYSGIDRVDSNLGYVAGNVVPCCADCNIAKNKMTLDCFLAMVERIRAHGPSVAKIRKLATAVCSDMRS